MLPKLLSNEALPKITRWTWRMSGQRDATYLDVELAEGVSPDTLKTAAGMFQYEGRTLGFYSSGAGSNLYPGTIYEDTALTTRATFNIGLQEQDPSAQHARGYQLFALWEDRLMELVKGLTVAEEGDEGFGDAVGGNTYGSWAAILGDARNFRLLEIYLREPVEGRLKSIDDVMRYLYDAWQSMLLVEDGDLKLVCLLDPPPAAEELDYITWTPGFDNAHDPNEAMQVQVLDRAEPFLLPTGADDPFPRRIPTIRLNEAEATLEITLQRLRQGADMRRDSVTLPLPHTFAELHALRPGQGLKVGGSDYWITEATFSWPDDTATLGIYLAGP